MEEEVVTVTMAVCVPSTEVTTEGGNAVELGVVETLVLVEVDEAVVEVVAVEEVVVATEDVEDLVEVDVAVDIVVGVDAAAVVSVFADGKRSAFALIEKRRKTRELRRRRAFIVGGEGGTGQPNK